MFILLSISILVITLSIYQQHKKKSSGVNIPDNKKYDVANFIKKHYMTTAINFSKTNDNKNLYVSMYDILSIIGVESGYYLFLGEKPENIIGDNGGAIGIMQIHQGALTDVNKSLETNYTINDLKNYYVNIRIGSHYLELCYKQAVKENSKNLSSLAYRKYNSGINNAHDNNTVSINYAERVNNFKELL